MIRDSQKINWNKYTVFQRRVLRLVIKIPSGKVLTYGQVAKRLGNPKLARAVGEALAKNLDAPTIPCHRVVGYNGIGGYSARGGIKMKATLLKKEGFNNF